MWRVGDTAGAVLAPWSQGVGSRPWCVRLAVLPNVIKGVAAAARFGCVILVCDTHLCAVRFAV